MCGNQEPALVCLPPGGLPTGKLGHQPSCSLHPSESVYRRLSTQTLGENLIPLHRPWRATLSFSKSTPALRRETGIKNFSSRPERADSHGIVASNFAAHSFSPKHGTDHLAKSRRKGPTTKEQGFRNWDSPQLPCEASPSPSRIWALDCGPKA